eukprot:4990644-Amphidinium_carterae.1
MDKHWARFMETLKRTSTPGTLVDFRWLFNVGLGRHELLVRKRPAHLDCKALGKTTPHERLNF